MNTRIRRSKGFTLVELLVVIAIIGILIGMLLPAVQQVRAAAQRSACQNNLKQISLAALNYESSFMTLPYGRKYDTWDCYTWTQTILPFMEQAAVHNNYFNLNLTGYKVNTAPNYPCPLGPIGSNTQLKIARDAPIPAYNCPSDFGPIGNEMDTTQFSGMRGNYRGCVGSGDMYGKRLRDLGTISPLGSGAFAAEPNQSFDDGTILPNGLGYFADGTSNTIGFSEGLMPQAAGWGGAIGMVIYGNMGGALFSTAITPNSSVPDQIYGPSPADLGDELYGQPAISIGGAQWGSPGTVRSFAAARSRHVGGVNGALVDGSVHFYPTSVNQVAWWSIGTADTGEVLNIAF